MATEFGDRTAFSVVDVGAMTFAEWDGAANALAPAGSSMKASSPAGASASTSSPTTRCAGRFLFGRPPGRRHRGTHEPAPRPRRGGARPGPLRRCGRRDRRRPRRGRPRIRCRRPLLPHRRRCGGLRHPERPGETVPVLAWDDAVTGDRSPFQAPRDKDDLADILYTSGTTGRLQKAWPLRHSNGSMVGDDRAETGPAADGSTRAPCSPLPASHWVYTPMKFGLRVIDQPRFEADRWLRVVEEERPVSVFLVPAMAHLLIDHPRFDEGRPVIGPVVLGGQRATCAVCRRTLAGQDARRPGLQ